MSNNNNTKNSITDLIKPKKKRNQINAIAARKQNKPYVILVEKNLAGASSTKKRKRDDNQQISPIENSADSSIPNAFLSPIMLSYLVTPKNLQPDTTLDNMVNDASKSKSSYFHDPEPNNENNNEYDDNIWEMEYDDDINNIDQEEESSPKNNSGGDDDEEHHIYDIDQKGEDNPILKCRNKCNNPLLTLKKNKNGIIAVSHMLYLKPSIR
ncbi:hypothetical protein GLOIN_2v1488989 [Rhizophagus irregularis DAOM 181602=DAOM 197198]|uniref:Uncharacterized protein n=1 Tax=Rhizophagus irregularis (strain DAOM 181602 / DAOM 197198 / MUCL 43194) TaxID=747089 RepID=A0A2P4NXR4_RHIID|nr:hypothetical protein GLOIN_2v1488989 [Rhizophagus irregularis DAOM 181602=DAOM 197198]POG57930.1 hypothetical protein GLOIN_2v1488989 [Rhizophagus irregularis DAOM 181602=DAOM 197198]|eukprot:XP_025164796.1 hypothetical protein GLOIN_2v1488989 [Rhizophagus irregularis DAOM 181602=DAOM 197198]